MGTDPAGDEPLPESRSPVKLRTAVAWSFALNAGRRASTTVITFVLAGLLGPAAFGTVALATIYVVLLQLLVQQGFAPALVRRPEITPQVLEIAFRIIMLASIAMSAVVVVTAGPIAELLGDPRLAEVLPLLTLQLPLSALGLVQTSLLRRESNFKSLSYRTNVAVLIGGVVGIAMALAGAGIQSLVGQQLVTALVATVLVWTQVPWRPRPSMRVSLVGPEARELSGYSARISVASVAQWGSGQIDSILIGALLGPAAVGVYRLAQRLVDTVLDLTARSFQVAFLSDLVRFNGEAKAFIARCLRQQRLTCALALPPLGVLAGSAAPLAALLGPEWDGAVGPLVLLSVGGVGLVVSALSTPILQAANHPGALARLQLLSAALLALAMIGAGQLLDAGAARDLGIPDVDLVAGLRAVVVCIAIVAVTLVVLRRRAGIGPFGVLRAAGSGLTAASAAATASVLTHAVTRAAPGLVDAGATVAIGGLVAVCVLLLIDGEVRSLVRKSAGRRRGSAAG